MALFDYDPLGYTGIPDTQRGESMGMLGGIRNWLSDPRNAQGLAAFGRALAQAGAPSRIGPTWGGGLSDAFAGMTEGRNAYDAQQFQRKFQEMKMREMETEAAKQQAEADRMKQAQARMAQFQQLMGGNTAMGLGAQQGSIGPTVANAARIPQDPLAELRGKAQMAIGGGFVDEGEKMLERATKMAPQVDKYEWTTGQDGKPQLTALFKDASAPKPMTGLGQIADPNKPFGPGGVPNLPYQQYEKEKARAGATNVNVPVNTEKTLMGNLAEKTAGWIDTARNQAIAASGTLANVQKLTDALDTNKIATGPLAKPEILMRQLGQALGAGGKDNAEVLANTRSAIQSLAQQELDSALQMKGQGQITEAEREIIKRAASGDISLTGPELRALSAALNKVAQLKIANYERLSAPLKKNPNAASLAPFLDVPKQPQSIDALLDKYK